MKIQAARAEEFSATSQTQATDHARGHGNGTAAAGARQGTDRFEASSDARLADQAIRASAESPDIRLDVVERARQKLMSGTLGADVEHLAGRMIDAMLGA